MKPCTFLLLLTLALTGCLPEENTSQPDEPPPTELEWSGPVIPTNPWEHFPSHDKCWDEEGNTYACEDGEAQPLGPRPE